MNTPKPYAGVRLRCGCLIRCTVTVGKDGRVDINHPRAIGIRLEQCPTHKHGEELLNFIQQVLPCLPPEQQRRGQLLLEDVITKEKVA